MRERERESDPAPAPDSTPPEGCNLGDMRTAAERLLAAADDAIERALSRDSRAFVASNRQHGGE